MKTAKLEDERQWKARAGRRWAWVRLVVRALLVMGLALHAEYSAKRECARRSRRCAFEECRRTVSLRCFRGFCWAWAIVAVGVGWVRVTTTKCKRERGARSLAEPNVTCARALGKRDPGNHRPSETVSSASSNIRQHSANLGSTCACAQ
jgi:hypothetical protein